MDARIGQLASGKFYAYVYGYDKEPVIGTLEEVEVALGLRTMDTRKPVPAPKPDWKRFSVVMRFQFPSWDEVDGIVYEVAARTKAEANKIARRMAENDGHAMSGKGCYWFTATEQGE